MGDFDKSMFEDGMKVFGKTAQLAEEMVLASKNLEDEATKLQTKASECLLAAETDKSKQVELKQKIEEEKKALLLSKEQTKQTTIALERKTENSKKEAEERANKKQKTEHETEDERKKMEDALDKAIKEEIAKVKEYDQARADKMKKEQDEVRTVLGKIRK